MLKFEYVCLFKIIARKKIDLAQVAGAACAWQTWWTAANVFDFSADWTMNVLNGLCVDSLVGDVVLVDIVVLDNDWLMVMMMMVMVDLWSWGFQAEFSGVVY